MNRLANEAYPYHSVSYGNRSDGSIYHCRHLTCADIREGSIDHKQLAAINNV